VTATGPAAMADGLFITDGPITRPAVITGNITADGPGCASRVRQPGFDSPGGRTANNGQAPSTARRRTPKLASLLSLPAARRCGKARALELRVSPAWRSKVQSVRVRIRGRTRVLESGSTLTVAGPRSGSLLARFTVTMHDGRVRTGQRRFRACR